MKPSQHKYAERHRAVTGRLPLLVAAVGRFAPALAGLLLLSGCASLPDWSPNLIGGEGNMAPGVPSRAVETAPVPPGQSWENVLAVQAYLTELGYDPGPIDGRMGPRTQSAIEAYQKATGTNTDGRITEQLIASLAAAARPPKLPSAKTAPGGKIDPGADFWAIIFPNAEPEAELVHVEAAGIPPHYDAGDTYIWSNGRVETVARIAGSKLFWRGDGGARYTADRNFLIPPSSWAGPSGSGEADARVNEHASWPLKAGKPLQFEVSSGGLLEKWRCRIGGARRVSVPAGRFDVVVLACERWPAPAGEWVRREWLYAPAVRHYVARTDILAGGIRTRMELVGIRPGAKDWPPAVRAGLDRAVQDVLGDLPAGERSLWSSTVVREEFEIFAGPVWNIDGAGRCRRFRLIAPGAGISRVYPALACARDADGKWRIPDDGDDDPNGISFLSGAG